MKKGSITVVGIGPGGEPMMSAEVLQAIRSADAVVGYTPYIDRIRHLVAEGARCFSSGMKKESERAEKAFALAREGERVVVVSSGDAGIYGMAPLVLEMQARQPRCGIDVQVLPGISAFQAAAARFGAPVSHDFCVISLSDLMTPWPVIEKRIRAAAEADFVTAVYNPKSHGRYWQIHRLKELFLEHRSKETPVGIAWNAGCAEEKLLQTTLGAFDPESLDMFSVLLIGNSATFTSGGSIITPRGYFREVAKRAQAGVGQSIMIESFRTIATQIGIRDHAPDKLWALLHTIHTTADFEFEKLLYTSEGAIAEWHERLTAGGASVVTDVTMVCSGLRKAALERYGISVHCYLGDPRVGELASRHGITRSQAAMRLAAQEHPEALFVVGNAPTALIELADLLRRGSFRPMGVIGAPVGFVHVVESKLRLKAACGTTPVAVVEGRKGGSSVAATIVNAAMSLDDADAMRPGRDV